MTSLKKLLDTRDDSGYGLTGYGGYIFVTSYTILTVCTVTAAIWPCLTDINRLCRVNMLTSSKILTG